MLGFRSIRAPLPLRDDAVTTIMIQITQILLLFAYAVVFLYHCGFNVYISAAIELLLLISAPCSWIMPYHDKPISC